ncbi:MAG: hypothetical protein V3T11_09945 [Roseateles sp.]
MAKIVVTNREMLVRLGRAVYEETYGRPAPWGGRHVDFAETWLDHGNDYGRFKPSLAHVCNNLHARMKQSDPNSKDRGGYIHLLRRLGCKEKVDAGKVDWTKLRRGRPLLNHDEKTLVAKAVAATGHADEYPLLGDWFDNIPSLCVVLRDYRADMDGKMEQARGWADEVSQRAFAQILRDIDDLIEKLCGGAAPKKKGEGDLLTDFLFPPLPKLPGGRLF